MSNFDFQTGGYSATGNNFTFPAPAELTGPPDDFDFTEAGYDPSSYSFNFGVEFPSFYIALAASNIFTSIWADVDAGTDTGKMYIATADSLNVIDLQFKSVVDHYTQTHAGARDEVLEQDDIVDINVVGV